MNKNKVKGSAILIVILTSIVLLIYTTSTYSEKIHLELLQKKYEKDIINYYGENNNEEDRYQEIINKNEYEGFNY